MAISALKLSESEYEIFALDPKVTKVTDFKTKEDSVDKATGLPLWKITVALTHGGETDLVTLKVASKDSPSIQPKTEYKVQGALYATPWLADGARNASVSFKVVGSLVPAKAARGE